MDGSANPFSDSQLKELKEKLPSFVYGSNETNKGKGATIRKGMGMSTAPFVIFTDLDFPYTLESMLDVFRNLKDGYDMVIGIKDKAYYKNVPSQRRFISKFLQRTIQFMLNLDVSDTQCGLKGFSKKGKTVLLATSIDRYLFDLEMVVLAKREKSLKFQATEVHLRDNVEFANVAVGSLSKEVVNLLKIIRLRYF